MVEIHREREGSVYEYVLKLWVSGKGGQLVPEEVRPKVARACVELFDKVDRIFAEYEPKEPDLS